MPIKIPNDLPAVKTLNDENIFVMTETRAITQDIRPLKILLLNLMPKKIETETQLSRLLGNSPLQVDFEFIHTKSHVSKNTSAEHLFTFYKTFDDVKNEYFDGFIDRAEPFGSEYSLKVSDEDFYIYLKAHENKHFSIGGISL